MEILGKESFIGYDFFLFAPSVILMVMLFGIGWLGNSQKAVLLTDIENGKENTVACEHIEKSKNIKSQKVHIKNRLEKLFNEEQIYLNKDLTIALVGCQVFFIDHYQYIHRMGHLSNDYSLTIICNL